MDRRFFIQSLAAAGVMGLSARSATALSGLAEVDADTSPKFVFILLRGAMDGLAVLPPIGSPAFTQLKGRDQDYGAYTKINRDFVAHPALPFINGQVLQGKAGFIPAMAGPYRSRSHFDAQDFLELGVASKSSMRSGWMARTANSMKGNDSQNIAVALSTSMPLTLAGTDRALQWAPDTLRDYSPDTLMRIMDLYAGHDHLEAVLNTAIESNEIASGMAMNSTMNGRGNRQKQFSTLAQAAGNFLKTKDGPSMALLELDGWDTHNAQDRRLSAQLAILDAGVKALHDHLGHLWQHTCVFIASEFGRTAHMNGTSGTDHGTAGTGIVLGGDKKIAPVLGDFPSLKANNLFDGRDVKPLNNTFDVIASILNSHMGISIHEIEKSIFNKDVLSFNKYL